MTNQSIKEAGTVILERTYNAPAAKVWSALTDVEKLRQWYFNVTGFEPKVGYKFEFTGEADCLEYLHICEVTEVEENRKIAYSWTYEGLEGHSVVSWELFPDGDKTKVVITHAGLDTFPKNKVFTRESFTGGWTYFLEEALEKFLAKE